MLNFQEINVNQFLADYWQQKPLLIRSALSNFIHPLSANELAGLAMEEDIESRLIIESPDKTPQWTLKQGPFTSRDYKRLPPSHWTLLVQGVDRVVPEVTTLLDHFNFLPQWRFDDVMISYAVNQGSVGPHYDNYDVFLYQAKGRRKWALTTRDCCESNYLENMPLRIMKKFNTEMEFILEEGDMLYLPPQIGHHGISLTDECMTYSFGYRSYQQQELWDSFGEYLADKRVPAVFYKAPFWTHCGESSELPEEAWQQAKKTLLTLLDDQSLLKDWFGGFVTRLDSHAESLLPMEITEDKTESFLLFDKKLIESSGLVRHSVCRFAYIKLDNSSSLSLYINGVAWNTVGVSIELIKKIANNRSVLLKNLLPLMESEADRFFIYDLWTLQWIEFY